MIAAVMASASLAPPLVLIADNKPPTDDSSVLANEKCVRGWPYCPFEQSAQTYRTVRIILVDRLE
jgi:hypothetical protein